MNGPGIEPFTAIRRGRWKLIYFHDGSRFELYDLRNDPGETRNLANSQSEQLEIMAEHMSVWMNQAGAQRSILIESGLPIDMPGVALETSRNRSD